MTGAAAISTGGGEGVAHDCHDFGTERFANGFAKGRSSFVLGSFEFVGCDSKFEPSNTFEGIPTFRRAILVVSFENIVIADVRIDDGRTYYRRKAVRVINTLGVEVETDEVADQMVEHALKRAPCRSPSTAPISSEATTAYNQSKLAVPMNFGSVVQYDLNTS